MDGESSRRKAATYAGEHKHRINAYTDIHGSSRIRTQIPAFDHAKTFHALFGTAIVIGAYFTCVG
jgi:hypothetical protein